jgi:hypothetical protein
VAALIVLAQRRVPPAGGRVVDREAVGGGGTGGVGEVGGEDPLVGVGRPVGAAVEDVDGALVAAAGDVVADEQVVDAVAVDVAARE